jgi:ankyrin repeat protein
MRITRVFGALCVAGFLPALGFGGAPSPLADAAMNKDKVAVRSLLRQKADVNAPQADGTTPLMWAVRYNDTEMVDLMLTAGANVKAANEDGATALYQAGVSGNAAIIEKLLKAGADVNGTFLSTGETALMEASRTGSVQAVTALLAHGAQVDAKDTLRQTTALMWAATQNHPEVIRVLIEHGADANAQSKTERDRVSSASSRGAISSPIASKLVKGGITPLVFAAREGAMDSVKVLLESKADIDQTTADGTSPLLVAVQNGHYDLARFLVERGSKLSIANQRGWSPLYIAIKHRNIETGELPVPPNKEQALDFIKFLLDHGAEVNGRLAFETETHSGNHPIWLKEEGATPFFRAAYAGDVEVMKLLLAHGADPAIPTTDLTTPLMAVAGIGYTLSFVHHRSAEEDLAGLKLLLDLGADVNAANKDGLTALMGAAHMGANDLVQTLVDRGAKLDAHSKGRCPSGSTNCEGGATALTYAEGLPTTSQSPLYFADTVALLEKLMADRGIPIPGAAGALSGPVAQSK